MNDQFERALDEIFEGYVPTPELQDLREEIRMNLTDRMREAEGKGISRQQALQLALEELGDVTEAVDVVSRRQRNEMIGQAYIGKAVPLDRLHAFGYPMAGLIMLFGFIVAAVTAVADRDAGTMIGALMPFSVFATGSFVFLGLTQETRQHYAMGRKRSLLYAVAAAVILFGFLVAGITLYMGVDVQQIYFGGIRDLQSRLLTDHLVQVLGVMIAFVLPGLALLSFLLLTEKTRKKPWVLRQEEREAQRYSEAFGVLSGALWLFALALFFLVGLLWQWRVAWVVFLFAVAGQCLIQYFTMKSK